MNEQQQTVAAGEAATDGIPIKIDGETVGHMVAPAANASTWRKRRVKGTWMTTQSGLAVRVRRLSLVQMVVSGEMPKPLQADVEKLVSRDIAVIDVANKHTPVIRAAVMIGVIEPRVVEGEVPADDDTRVSINELSFDDLIQIYTEITAVRGGLLPHRMLAFLETE